MRGRGSKDCVEMPRDKAFASLNCWNSFVFITVHVQYYKSPLAWSLDDVQCAQRSPKVISL